MIGQLETMNNRSNLLHSLSIGAKICWLLPTSINYAKLLGQNHFVEPN
jgi:hypothetical protein